jgi:ABC-2 type transport system ATP-binding protein
LSPIAEFGAGANSIVLKSVSKIFRHRPALFNWLGTERVGKTCALTDVSLAVPASHILALLGPNGSGKTTLLKLICAILLPDAGRVLVEGSDIQTDAQAIRRKVGFAVASERSFFPRLTARENLDFFATLDEVPRESRAERITNILEKTRLADAADRLVMKFSTGMQQRLGIARALLKEPSIVLLDEPTRSLDPASTGQFWQWIHELPLDGVTVIIATHNFQEAVTLADSAALLLAGKLLDHRRLGRTTADELRSLYFDCTGEENHLALAAEAK